MMATRRGRRTPWTAGALAALVLVATAACSASDDSGGGSSDSSAGGSVAEPAVADRDATGGDAAVASQTGADVEQQKVISTGTVQLRADDVGQAIFDVHKVVDLHQGTVAQDATETDDDGDPLRSRMVLRIPTEDFEEALAALEEVATLVASDHTTEDVTTQVLDVDVRVEAEKRSIDRIQVLFDQATSIKDIVSIENELSRRQADLASLEQQQRYLADQTQLSTITVSVERTPEHEKSDDHTGFLAGLGAGWHGLQTFAVALATVVGALLPWLVLLLVLALPGWPLVRRVRRREAPAA
jgi:hypothetical protein